MKYWNNEGTYQAEYQSLYDELVPSEGKCDSVAGELIRAASRLYYDAYNNGFLNNTSGAYNYLVKYLLPLSLNQEELSNALDIIKYKCNTGSYSFICEDTNKALDLIVDEVVLSINRIQSLKTTPNREDLFDLQDDDVYELEDEDYSDD